MDEMTQRMIEVRQQISRWRVMLGTTSDEAIRQQIYRRLIECVTEATRLLDQRLQSTIDSSDEPLSERSVSE